ncbi:dermonecrotic toxin domain-containing protein [Pseudomonas aegrilactucae]|uniref:Dermonecrotic toxin N-terminal domain-containing protein n=1 Tax=Pseudomonas aegrilactucae TaxID=2854028 RepID=A0A9Q2XPU9_9PSED|nr:DUF6543 domain-containing protein [Pseudomonas aegrilactucae]MBV6289994.1 hypothetical protein [Pseudomonas aegrilactucae]
MHVTTLPYFHVDALRRRFVDHLDQAHREQALATDQQDWLKSALLATRDAPPDAGEALRVDRLSAITDTGTVIELTASLLLSRSTQTPVYLYHPLAGLLRFDDRAQLKAHLIEQLATAPSGPLLHYATQADRQRFAQDAVEDIQVELLEGSVFEYLMLTINRQLGLSLGELERLLLEQPDADTLWEQALASTTAATPPAHRRLSAARYCSQQLRRYWYTKGTLGTPAAQQLTQLMRGRLREAVIRQAWATTLSPQEQAQLLAWLQQPSGSQLHAWSVTVTTLESYSQPLDGLLVLASIDASGPLFSYCAARGLERHVSRRALLCALADPLERERWLALVSPSQREHLRALRINALHLNALTLPALEAWVNALLRAQQHEIETQTSLQGTVDAYQACRQALAIGTQLAPELSRLAPLAPLALPGPASLAQRENAVRAGTASLDDLYTYLGALVARIEALQDAAPGLETVTAARLEQAFAAVLDTVPHNALAIDQINVRQGAEDHRAPGLAEQVWQRLSGTAAALAPSWQVIGPVLAEQPVPLPGLPLALVAQCLNHVADTSLQALACALGQHQRQMSTYNQHLWQLALDIEYRLIEHDNALARPARELIDAALAPSSAHAWPTLAWQLELDHSACADALLLSQQPLNASPSLLVLWTRDEGFSAFTSLAALDTVLAQRFAHATLRTWLALDGPPAHALAALDSKRSVDTALHAFTRLKGRGLPAACLPAMLRNGLQASGNLQHLRRLQRMANAQRLRATLPDWLGRASALDQYGYWQALARNLLQSPSQQDYLFDLPSIPDYAKARVQARLDQDFAAGRYPADELFITSTRWVTALPPPGEVPSAQAAASIRHRQTLIEYALNHYRDWDQPITAIELKGDMTVPARIDAAYLRTLVRELDLGAGYQQLLKTHLTPTHPDYPKRQALFCRQLPGQLLEAAWRARLKGTLSAAGVDCIRAVLEHPDATARGLQPMPAVQLLPLELIADRGMPPDTVPGIYLFMGQGPTPGPVVMYIPYEASGIFRAFGSPADLLHQLKTDPSLQALVLARLPEALRQRYDHGGFTQAHLPFSAEFDFELPLYPQQPVALAHRPVQGNALLYLFHANLVQLQDMASAQLVTRAQVRWNTLNDVLGLLWTPLTMFVPGRIGLLLAAWQSELALLQIVDSAGRRGWSAQLSELTCVLLQSLLIGHSLRAPDAPTLPASENEFWQRLSQSAHQQLAGYEVPQQALDGLTAHEQIYASVDGSEHFVVLDGKVYRTRQLDERWHLSAIDIDEPGPSLHREGSGPWQIDPKQSLTLLGGGVLGRLGGWAARRVMTSTDLIIRAVGMREIRQRMPTRADLLRRAHRQALDYLSTCLDNLHYPADSMAVQTREILCDFFGIDTPDDALLQRVRKPVEKILSMMASPAYSPASSQRYILVSNVGTYDGIAFTSPHDPLKQIFILDAYFDYSFVDKFDFKPDVSWHEADAAGRANCLIHEFSHIAYDTRDMRYLEASASFAEMIMPGDRLDWLKRQHDEGFSHRSPARRLFVVRSRNGTRRDITRDDNKGLSIIQQLAGTQDLAVARARFLSDPLVRSKIMLKNADSLTLLVYRLGNRSHRLPPPEA